MSKKQSLRKKIERKLGSFFVIMVLVVPMVLTGRWLVSALGQNESRKVITPPALQVRDIDKSTTPIKLFNEPLVTITFDDGWESVYTAAFVPMQEDGLLSTQYIMSGSLDNPLYMSVAQLQSMQHAGHSIGGHTDTHADLTMLDDAGLYKELAGSQQKLQKNFGPIKDFTSPYGAYNTYTLQTIAKYYRSQKNAEGDPSHDLNTTLNTQTSFDPLNIKSFSVRNTTTLYDLQKLIDGAIKEKAWLVLTYHQVDYSQETFSVNPNEFKDQMKLVSNARLRSASIGQVLESRK